MFEYPNPPKTHKIGDSLPIIEKTVGDGQPLPTVDKKPVEGNGGADKYPKKKIMVAVVEQVTQRKMNFFVNCTDLIKDVCEKWINKMKIEGVNAEQLSI